MRLSIGAMLLSAMGVLAIPAPDVDEPEAPNKLHERGCKVVHPKGRVCGDHGEVTTPQFIEIARPFELLTDLQQCRDLCLGNPKCKSFLYNSPALQCVPYTTHIEPTNHPIYLKAAPGRLYDRECFQCT